MKKPLSQSYLSQLEGGTRRHLTNTSRLLLSKFFKVHPGYLVDDPEGFQTELISDFSGQEDKLDLWLVQGAERFRRDSSLAEALLVIARHEDTRKCVLLLAAVIETPELIHRLWDVFETKGRERGMNFAEFFLICFGVGTLWAIVSLFAGGLHLGHGGHGHLHHAGAHGHMPHWLTSLLNPSCIAVFLAWFGGAGYLLNKYSGLLLWLNLAIALGFGLIGARILAAFLAWLMKTERVMNPADYDMVGVLGRVSSTIRADGVGEVIYLHEGARRSLNAKSETGVAIARGEEVVVTHFEKGIALVRTWEAMTQPKSIA